MKLAQGMILADRYEIIELIGAGGMALVYKAMDLKLERIITVKVLREEYVFDDEFLKRFNVEARSAASLSHHNIVNVYDVGKEGDINFIIMEYIDGVTLKELIVRRAPFDNEESLGVAIQIALGLSHAHKNGIIHRDIKPQNILVTKNGVVKVTDFGIARSASSQTTTTSGSAMGSVHYFSPEQARGKYVDYRSDIYALGIVMFEMTAGVLPFDGDSAVAVALKHINEELPDVRTINPGVSVSVLKIIDKAAAKSAALRYSSADEMLLDLRKAISDESGEFVSLNSDTITSATLVLGSDELEGINREALYGDFDNGFEDEYYDEDDPEYYDEDDNEDDNLDKSTERKIIVAAICTAIAIIILITSIGFWYFNRESPSGNNTGQTSLMVPLQGMTVDEAREILTSMGIEIGQVDEGYSDEYGEGLIIAQTPDVGTEINRGSIIAVTTSRGTDKIEVPDATKKVISDVYTMKEFANNTFSIGENYIFDNDFANHVVISQSPAAGSLAPRGSTIVLTISKGKEIKKVLVPNLLGDTEEAAKRKLEEANLKIGQVTTGHSEDYPAGQVFKQSYDGGKEVNEGTAVTFIISSGARPAQSTESPAPSTSSAPNSIEIPAPSPSASSSSGGLVPATTIVIPAPMEALNQGPVRVHVNQIMEGSTERLYEKSGLLMSDFPISLTVTGSQPFEIQIYVNGQLESRESFDLQ